MAWCPIDHPLNELDHLHHKIPHFFQLLQHNFALFKWKFWTGTSVFFKEGKILGSNGQCADLVVEELPNGAPKMLAISGSSPSPILLFSAPTRQTVLGGTGNFPVKIVDKDELFFARAWAREWEKAWKSIEHCSISVWCCLLQLCFACMPFHGDGLWLFQKTIWCELTLAFCLTICRICICLHQTLWSLLNNWLEWLCIFQAWMQQQLGFSALAWLFHPSNGLQACHFPMLACSCMACPLSLGKHFGQKISFDGILSWCHEILHCSMSDCILLGIIGVCAACMQWWLYCLADFLVKEEASAHSFFLTQNKMGPWWSIWFNKGLAPALQSPGELLYHSSDRPCVEETRFPQHQKERVKFIVMMHCWHHLQSC